MKKAFCLLMVFAFVAISSRSLAKVAKTEADKIVHQALAADQAGDGQQRDRLLAEALKVDPDNKLAHWHSGQVLFNGKWKSIEAIQELVSSDPRWQEYRQLVESFGDTLEAHVEVARWCRTQDLELEEKWHWFNVLRHNARHREALVNLGLRPFQGSLMTEKQIAEYEASEEQSKDDFKRYAKSLKTAMRNAERSEGTERTAALKQISGISDPAAIQAIVEVVLADAKNENRILSKLSKPKAEKLLRQMQLAAITALSEIPEHEATLRLLEVALYASDSQVRDSAAKALKYREPTSFMPMLMAGLAAPVELSIAVNTLPNGQITVMEDFIEEGPLAQKKHTRSSSFLTQHALIDVKDRVGIPRGGPSVPTVRKSSVARVWSDQAQDMHNAAARIANSENRVAVENAIRMERNARIQHVMEIASGKSPGETPEAWWSDWKDYNEIYTPEELPVYETSASYDYSRYVETPMYRTESYLLPAARPTRPGARNRTVSCFVAGTPVWTQAGPVPIETLQIGDLVLSQNPHTGELDYRPVIDTTIRPPSPTVELAVNEEKIVATRGHRFWVSGTGWRMAKFLKAGDMLFAVTGSTDLHSAEEGPEASAYNLEVGQFHTYFVGASRVLVLDNSCPQPTTNLLPGASPRADIAPQLAVRN